MERARTSAIVALVTVLMAATAAWAQQAGSAETAPVEVGLGVTINSAGTDVNALPACLTLALPCTHSQKGQWGGFGLDLGVDSRVAPHVAITASAGVAGYGWDSPATAATHRQSVNVVRAFLVGPTFRSEFRRPRAAPHETDRFFGRVLVGVEHSTLFQSALVIQPSIGVDSYCAFGRRREHYGTIRMELGYRLSLDAPYPVGGLHVFFGAVLGPRGE